jgi:phosphomannomutase
MTDESIFKAYDIRGVYPDQIDEEAAYKIAQAYAKLFEPKAVVLGRDVRLSGPALWEAAKNGFIDHGVDVVDIGVITTDMMYFAVANYGYDGGITISASHNPKEYNGMKLVRAGALPISGDTGINDIKKLAMDGYGFQAPIKGELKHREIQDEYVEKCLTFIDKTKIKPFKVVANAMFGCALQNVIKMNLPINLVLMNETPDGNFPKGQPDPLQGQNQIETVEIIKKEKPDFGVAWDADADRFFLFDENGRFIPGYYITAFLAKHIILKHPGQTVICDPRLNWAVHEKVIQAGGQVIVNKVGHSFIKERMRKNKVIFAGEMSGHYYFRDFFYCDNGLIPFLMLLQIFSETEKKVSDLFGAYFFRYPISGEINTKLPDQSMVAPILQKIEDRYKDAKIEKIDGLSIEYDAWRANIRSSNTEPLIRLNVEAKDDGTLKAKTDELLAMIRE